MTGVWVLVAAVVVAAVVGVVMRVRDGRFRTRSGAVAPVPAEAPGLLDELTLLGAEPGGTATLLQFSSAFCQPCRATRRILTDVAATVPGVTHVEVDAEDHLELVRRLSIRRTPTVLVLDAGGREVRRASGAPPHRDAVMAAIEAAVDAH